MSHAKIAQARERLGAMADALRHWRAAEAIAAALCERVPDSRYLSLLAGVRGEIARLEGGSDRSSPNPKA